MRNYYSVHEFVSGSYLGSAQSFNSAVVLAKKLCFDGKVIIKHMGEILALCDAGVIKKRKGVVL